MSEIQHFETHGGQCVPGARCHVDPDGVLHMCEHMAHHFPIGSIPGGFDSDRIEHYLTQFGRLVEDTCSDCWALRLCRKCFANLARGPGLSRERMAEVCSQKLEKLERSLVQYCSARERNADCFDWMPERANDPEED
ncbi:MAG: SPASM domain-containing protein [Syntrophobacteraceae bacterium]|nr:SPASM domain-containing protein [Syntrophobacteraceae bacterium]